MLHGYVLDYNGSQRRVSRPQRVIALPLEDRTARLTTLIDLRKKALFERLCTEEDATPSQVVRRLIRRCIEERTGRPWNPPEGAPWQSGGGKRQRVGGGRGLRHVTAR